MKRVDRDGTTSKLDAALVYVYSFGNNEADGNGRMLDELGRLGAKLADMSLAKFPVPPGFTISTKVCRLFFENGNRVPKDVDDEVCAAIDKLQKQTGKRL